MLVPRVIRLLVLNLVATMLALGCGCKRDHSGDFGSGLADGQRTEGSGMSDRFPDRKDLVDQAPPHDKPRDETTDVRSQDNAPFDSALPSPFQVVWDKVVLAAAHEVDSSEMTYENGQRLCFMGTKYFYCFTVDGKLLVQEPLPGKQGNLTCCGGIVRGASSYGTFAVMNSTTSYFLTFPTSGKIANISNAVPLKSKGSYSYSWDTLGKRYLLFSLDLNTEGLAEINSLSFDESGKLKSSPQLANTPAYQATELIDHVLVGDALLLAGWGHKYSKGTPLPYSAAATTWGYILETPFAKVSKVVDLAPFGYHTGGAGVYPQYSESRLATDGKAVFFGWTNFDLFGNLSLVAGIKNLTSTASPVPAVITQPPGKYIMYPWDTTYHKGHFFLLLTSSSPAPMPGLYLVGYNKDLKEIFPLTHLPQGKPTNGVFPEPRIVALKDDLLIIYVVPGGPASVQTHFMRVAIKGLP